MRALAPGRSWRLGGADEAGVQAKAGRRSEISFEEEMAAEVT